MITKQRHRFSKEYFLCQHATAQRLPHRQPAWVNAPQIKTGAIPAGHCRERPSADWGRERPPAGQGIYQVARHGMRRGQGTGTRAVPPDPPQVLLLYFHPNSIREMKTAVLYLLP